MNQPRFYVAPGPVILVIVGIIALIGLVMPKSPPKAGAMTYPTLPVAVASPMTGDDGLKAFTQFVLYIQACNVDPSVIEPDTFDTMTNLMKLRPQAQRDLIGQQAAMEVKALIAAGGLAHFCAIYGSEMTPVIRSLNKATRTF